MEQLSGLDSAFLALESSTTHLHIVGAMVVDPTGVPGGLDVDRLRRAVADRLHRIPPFTKRLVTVPFELGHPYLVDDPCVDLGFHVRRASVPTPGGRGELAAFVADLASRPLARDRPLWELHLAEGLEGDQVAVVAKVHHAILDGIAGVDVLAELFDLSPDGEARPLFAKPDSRIGGDTAHSARRDRPAGSARPHEVRHAKSDAFTRWASLLASIPGSTEDLVRTAARTVRRARSRAGGDDPGTGDDGTGSGTRGPALSWVFEAPPTSINGAISAHRRAAVAELPMAGIEHVRSVLGGTVNDVVLAAVSGGMRALFADRGEQPESSLIAMVPVSVRTEDERNTFGNRVSAMFVSLATGVEDPVFRYRRIRDATRSAKEQDDTVVSELWAEWADVLVPAVSSRLSRLATGVRLFDRLGPPFNLIVSNVPGPDISLYLAGSRLVALFPFGPIVEGVGVNVTVLSYGDTVYVGVLGCWDLVPDVAMIAGGMTATLGVLVEAAKRRGRPVPWWHAEVPA